MRWWKWVFILLIAVGILGGIWYGKQSGQPSSNNSSSQNVSTSHSIEQGNRLPATSSSSPPQASTDPEVQPIERIHVQVQLEDQSTPTTLRGLDGEFERMKVEGAKKIQIQLSGQNWKAGQKVRVEAGNGGSLNGGMNPLELNVNANGQIDFVYGVGGHRGLYVVEVGRDGKREALLEFWVGPEPVMGKPGPDRTF